MAKSKLTAFVLILLVLNSMVVIAAEPTGNEEFTQITAGGKVFDIKGKVSVNGEFITLANSEIDTTNIPEGSKIEEINGRIIINEKVVIEGGKEISFGKNGDVIIDGSSYNADQNAVFDIKVDDAGQIESLKFTPRDTQNLNFRYKGKEINIKTSKNGLFELNEKGIIADSNDFIYGDKKIIDPELNQKDQFFILEVDDTGEAAKLKLLGNGVYKDENNLIYTSKDKFAVAFDGSEPTSLDREAGYGLNYIKSSEGQIQGKGTVIIKNAEGLIFDSVGGDFSYDLTTNKFNVNEGVVTLNQITEDGKLFEIGRFDSRSAKGSAFLKNLDFEQYQSLLQSLKEKGLVIGYKGEALTFNADGTVSYFIAGSKRDLLTDSARIRVAGKEKFEELRERLKEKFGEEIISAEIDEKLLQKLGEIKGLTEEDVQLLLAGKLLERDISDAEKFELARFYDELGKKDLERAFQLVKGKEAIKLSEEGNLKRDIALGLYQEVIDSKLSSEKEKLDSFLYGTEVIYAKTQQSSFNSKEEYGKAIRNLERAKEFTDDPKKLYEIDKTIASLYLENGEYILSSEKYSKLLTNPIGREELAELNINLAKARGGLGDTPSAINILNNLIPKEDVETLTDHQRFVAAEAYRALADISTDNNEMLNNHKNALAIAPEGVKDGYRVAGAIAAASVSSFDEVIEFSKDVQDDDLRSSLREITAEAYYATEDFEKASQEFNILASSDNPEERNIGIQGSIKSALFSVKDGLTEERLKNLVAQNPEQAQEIANLFYGDNIIKVDGEDVKVSDLPPEKAASLITEVAAGIREQKESVVLREEHQTKVDTLNRRQEEINKQIQEKNKEYNKEWSKLLYEQERDRDKIVDGYIQKINNDEIKIDEDILLRARDKHFLGLITPKSGKEATAEMARRLAQKEVESHPNLLKIAEERNALRNQLPTEEDLIKLDDEFRGKLLSISKRLRDFDRSSLDEDTRRFLEQTSYEQGDGIWIEAKAKTEAADFFALTEEEQRRSREAAFTKDVLGLEGRGKRFYDEYGRRIEYHESGLIRTDYDTDSYENSQRVQLVHEITTGHNLRDLNDELESLDYELVRYGLARDSPRSRYFKAERDKVDEIRDDLTTQHTRLALLHKQTYEEYQTALWNKKDLTKVTEKLVSYQTQFEDVDNKLKDIEKERAYVYRELASLGKRELGDRGQLDHKYNTLLKDITGRYDELAEIQKKFPDNMPEKYLPGQYKREFWSPEMGPFGLAGIRGEAEAARLEAQYQRDVGKQLDYLEAASMIIPGGFAATGARKLTTLGLTYAGKKLVQEGAEAGVKRAIGRYMLKRSVQGAAGLIAASGAFTTTSAVLESQQQIEEYGYVAYNPYTPERYGNDLAMFAVLGGAGKAYRGLSGTRVGYGLGLTKPLTAEGLKLTAAGEIGAFGTEAFSLAAFEGYGSPLFTGGEFGITQEGVEHSFILLGVLKAAHSATRPIDALIERVGDSAIEKVLKTPKVGVEYQSQLDKIDEQLISERTKLLKIADPKLIDDHLEGKKVTLSEIKNIEVRETIEKINRLEGQKLAVKSGVDYLNIVERLKDDPSNAGLREQELALREQHQRNLEKAGEINPKSKLDFIDTLIERNAIEQAKLEAEAGFLRSDIENLRSGINEGKGETLELLKEHDAKTNRLGKTQNKIIDLREENLNKNIERAEVEEQSKNFFQKLFSKPDAAEAQRLEAERTLIDINRLENQVSDLRGTSKVDAQERVLELRKRLLEEHSDLANELSKDYLQAQKETIQIQREINEAELEPSSIEKTAKVAGLKERSRLAEGRLTKARGDFVEKCRGLGECGNEILDRSGFHNEAELGRAKEIIDIRIKSLEKELADIQESREGDVEELIQQRQARTEVIKKLKENLQNNQQVIERLQEVVIKMPFRPIEAEKLESKTPEEALDIIIREPNRISELGEGTSGKVYQIGDLALKVSKYDPARPHDLGAVQSQAKLEQESRLLDRLEGVEGVVQKRGEIIEREIVKIQGESITVEALPLKFVEGVPISDIRTLTQKQHAEFAKQLETAVKEIHKREVIHDDLKPENVLVDIKQDGSVKVTIIDFGKGSVSKDTAKDLRDYNNLISDLASKVRIKASDLSGAGEFKSIMSLILGNRIQSQDLGEGVPLVEKSVGEILERGRTSGLSEERIFDEINKGLEDLVKKSPDLDTELKIQEVQSVMNNERLKVERLLREPPVIAPKLENAELVEFLAYGVEANSFLYRDLTTNELFLLKAEKPIKEGDVFLTHPGINERIVKPDFKTESDNLKDLTELAERTGKKIGPNLEDIIEVEIGERKSNAIRMEYIKDAVPLRDVKQLTREQFVDIQKQIREKFEFAANERGIVHPDLHFGNILYNQRTGEITLIDWGGGFRYDLSNPKELVDFEANKMYQTSKIALDLFNLESSKVLIEKNVIRQSGFIEEVREEQTPPIISKVIGEHPQTKVKPESNLYEGISPINVEEVFQIPLPKSGSRLGPDVEVYGAKAVVYKDKNNKYVTAFLTETEATHHRHAVAKLVELDDPSLKAQAEAFYQGDLSKSASILQKSIGFEMEFDQKTGKIIKIKQDSWVTKRQEEKGLKFDRQEMENYVLNFFENIDQNLLDPKYHDLKWLDDPSLREEIIPSSLIK